MDDYILSIDLGTSGVKVGFLNLVSLTLENVVVRDYDHSPEQDTEELFDATMNALQESVEAVGNRKYIRAIGLTGQMHGAVLYNQAGEVIHPLINWQERKYSHEKIIEKMNTILGPEGYQDAGIDLANGLSGAILFGIKENHPDLFVRIKKFVLPTDFIRGKLLGRLDGKTDQTNAFGTGLYNVRESRWHLDMITKLGLPLDIFPEVHSTSDIAGVLYPDIVDILGLEKSIPVVIGGGDNQMSMLGSGLISLASPVLINIGTAAQISMVISDFVRIPGVDTRSFFNNSYALVGASLAGGGSYQWLRDQIQAEEGQQVSYVEMDVLASQIPPGADGLVFCPGPSRSKPERVRGFYGNCAYQSSIGHQARAVMEGVIFDLYELYQGIRLYCMGEIMIGAGKGLQNSKIWSQIAADVFQKPLRITNFENALFGAGIMAAVGIDAVGDFISGVSTIKYEQVNPIQDHGSQYQNKVFENWRSVLDLI